MRVRRSVTVSATFFVGLLLPNSATAQPDFADSLKALASRGVVVLSSVNNAGSRTSLALGFIVADGRVVTDLDAVRGASRVLIQGGGVPPERRSVKGLVAYSEEHGIAVLDARADSSRALRLLDGVEQFTTPLAVGTPAQVMLPVEWLGLRSVLTAEGDTTPEVGVLEGFVPRGTSGAPVLDQEGRVVGMARQGQPDDRFELVATPAYYIEAALNEDPAYYPFALFRRRAPVRWKLIVRLDSGAYYLDVQSIERDRAGVAFVWTKHIPDFPEKDEEGAKITHVLHREQVDCRKPPRYRTVGGVTYSGTRSVRSWDDHEASWSATIPDTVGEELFRSTCLLIARHTRPTESRSSKQPQ